VRAAPPQVIVESVKSGERPTMSDGTSEVDWRSHVRSAGLVALVEACWAQEPVDRLEFVQIGAALDELEAAASDGQAACSGAAARAEIEEAEWRALQAEQASRRREQQLGLH
jgi:hypothetical protein